METDIEVTEHHAKDLKEKYTVVLEGETREGDEVKLVVTSRHPDILDLYPRGSEFSVKLAKGKQKKLDEAST